MPADPRGPGAEPLVEEARGSLSVLVAAPLADLGVDCIVTTRAGGVSTGPYATLNLGEHVGDVPAAVTENRRRLASAMGLAPDRLVIAKQVHGARVAIASIGAAVGEADALMVTSADLGVAVLVADCAPILLVDPDAAVLGVVHAGWRGAAARVVPAALEAMVALGARHARIAALVGPCISATTYEVGPEVGDAFAAVGCGRDVHIDAAGIRRADITGALTRQLRDAGVDASRMWRTAWSTDGGGRLFSDRAERPCGRFALAARLKPRT